MNRLKYFLLCVLCVFSIMMFGCSNSAVVTEYNTIKVCDDVDEEKGCIDNMSSFGNPKAIFATIIVKDAVKGDLFRAVWFDADNNQKLKEDSVDLKVDGDPVLEFSLSHNMDKWIPGTYAIKVYKNNEKDPISTNNFEVGIE